jgi:hypothetical protein
MIYTFFSFQIDRETRHVCNQHIIEESQEQVCFTSTIIVKWFLMSYLDCLNFCMYIVSSKSVVCGPWTTKINMLNEKLIVGSDQYRSFNIYIFAAYHNMLLFQFMDKACFILKPIALISAFFLKKMFRGTLSLTQENYHFIVQIGKNKCSQRTQISIIRLELVKQELQHFKSFTFSR